MRCFHAQLLRLARSSTSRPLAWLDFEQSSFFPALSTRFSAIVQAATAATELYVFLNRDGTKTHHQFSSPKPSAFFRGLEFSEVGLFFASFHHFATMRGCI